VAAGWLASTQYAELSYFQAWVMLVALFIDLGVGHSVLRQASLTKEPRYFLVGLQIKTAIAIAGVSIAGIALLVGGALMILPAVLAAVLLSLNTTYRIYQTQISDYQGLLISSTVMAVAACVGAAVALPTQDWRIIAIGAFVVPPFLALSIGSAKVWGKLFADVSAKDLLAVMAWMPHVFVSGMLFSATIPVYQIIIKEELGSKEFATLGLSLSLSGALGLLVTSFRTAMYAQFASFLTHEGITASRRFRKFVQLSLPFWALYLAASVLVCLVAHVIYDSKYEGILGACAVLCAGFGITGLIGFYNIRFQTLGLRRFEIIVNVGRFGVIASAALRPFTDPFSAAAVLACLLAAFEILYMVAGDWWLSRRLAPNSP
jgi:hypothetical protein